MALYDYTGGSLDIIFANVTEYGAKGDGVTDDTTAIQSALAACQASGGIVYFPVGSYLVTASLLFYSNTTLWFEPEATILQGASIDNLLMSYCGDSVTGYGGTHDCLIYGATFDGSTYTKNNTLVGIVHAKNITFENCTFKNAYGQWHDLEINSSYNVKVVRCDFEGSRKTYKNAELIQIDAIDNTNTWPWTNRGSVDSTISKYVEICNCIFHNDTVSPAIGNHSVTSDSFISIHDNVFDGLTSERGALNFQSADNVDIYDNVFNGCTTGVGSYGATYYIRNNRFVSATTAIAGSASVAHGNMINGTYTA